MNNWKILSIELNNKENQKNNVIKRIHWMRFSENENITGILNFESIDLNNFIEYDSLNNDTLISWIEANVDKDYLDNLINDIELEKQNLKIIANPFTENI